MKNLLIIVIGTLIIVLSAKALNAQSQCKTPGTLVMINYTDQDGNAGKDYDFDLDGPGKPHLQNGDTILIVSFNPKVFNPARKMIIKASTTCKNPLSPDCREHWPNATIVVGFIQKITPVKKCTYTEVEKLFIVKK
jgi:hypothetical protein